MPGASWEGRDGAVERAKIVYDIAVSNLSLQHAEIDNIRSRTSMLLAATAIATSFLGGEVLKVDSAVHNVIVWLALAAFIAASGAILFVLKPRVWHFYLLVDSDEDPKGLIQKYVTGPKERSLARSYIILAKRIDGIRMGHRSGLQVMHRWLRAAMLIMVVEIALWIFCIAGVRWST